MNPDPQTTDDSSGYHESLYSVQHCLSHGLHPIQNRDVYYLTLYRVSGEVRNSDEPRGQEYHIESCTPYRIQQKGGESFHPPRHDYVSGQNVAWFEQRLAKLAKVQAEIVERKVMRGAFFSGTIESLLHFYVHLQVLLPVHTNCAHGIFYFHYPYCLFHSGSM